MNKIVLMGRLTADPEMRQTSNGIAVCSFSVAVNRRFAKEGQQNVDFINCTAWGKTAEFLCNYFSKGQMLALCGRLEQSRYEKDGTIYTAYSVTAEDLYFTGSKVEQHTAAPLDAAEEKARNLGLIDDDFGNVEGLPF